MDELELRDPVNEVAFYYWRGRRDGYEGAAYELYLELELVGRPGSINIG